MQIFQHDAWRASREARIKRTGSGGFIPDRILRTFLEKPILTVSIAYCDAENRPSKTPRTIQWIDEVEKKLHGRRILRHRPAEIRSS